MQYKIKKHYHLYILYMLTWVAIKSPTITSQISTYTDNHFTDKLFLPTQNSPTLDLLTSSFSPTSWFYWHTLHRQLYLPTKSTYRQAHFTKNRIYWQAYSTNNTIHRQYDLLTIQLLTIQLIDIWDHSNVINY